MEGDRNTKRLTEIKILAVIFEGIGRKGDTTIFGKIWMRKDRLSCIQYAKG